MATKLDEQVRIGTDADYLNGNLEDSTTGDPGTLLGRGVLQDIVQFFQRLMVSAGITANGDEDNEDNGYQFVDALKAYVKSEVLIVDDAPQFPTLNSDWISVVGATPDAFKMQYWKDKLGNVYINGRIEAVNAVSASSTLFTLPTGYQVSSLLQGVPINSDAGVGGRLYYDNSPKGEVQLVPNGTVAIGDRIDIHLMIFKEQV